MNNKREIKCPNCNVTFQLDESHFSSIVTQIRNQEFDSELEKREKKIADNYQFQQERIKNEYDNKILEQKQNFEELKSEKQKWFEQKIQEQIELQKQKDQAEILALKAQIQSLQNQTEIIKNSVEDKINLEKRKLEDSYLKKDEENKDLKTQIMFLNQQIKNYEQSKKSEIENVKKEVVLEAKENFAQEKSNLITQYNFQISKLENEKELLRNEFENYKNFKANHSVKLIGESLEKHCENEFQIIKQSGGFKDALFEKDNQAIDGTKGDFIYRDFQDGIEFISIMFEMKNESENSAEKNRKENKHFYEKLHKDRVKKGCEYAVLVSMLEQENDFYNRGIVDVSTSEFPKMYVIRPQFFIQFISILRNAALNSLEKRRELEVYKQKNIDITNFEANINSFKIDFGKNIERAAKNFEKAIKEIDEAIKKLQNTRDELVKSGNQIRIANDKVQDITLKKLTKNCESIRVQIERK